MTLQRLASEPSRLRAGCAQADRSCRCGPTLLPQPGTTTPVTAIDMASKRRGLAAYEANGVKGFVVLVALLSLGCFILAWVQRGTPGAALAMVVMGIPLAVAAALIPRWTKSWYEKNRRLVDLYDQQRAGQVGPPPPPPPPPAGPTDQHPGEWGGQ